MVQEAAHNTNVTLKGYPRKFWGLFGLKAQKTQEITLKHNKSHYSNAKEGLSLTQTYQGQTYNLKCNPYQLPSETLGFSWDGHAYSACITPKFPDWFNSQN